MVTYIVNMKNAVCRSRIFVILTKTGAGLILKSCMSFKHKKWEREERKFQVSSTVSIPTLVILVISETEPSYTTNLKQNQLKLYHESLQVKCVKVLEERSYKSQWKIIFFTKIINF